MNTPPAIVFLVDVDNTLLDNDRVEADLRQHLAHEFGTANRDRYWAIFEALRNELGYADYLGALQRYRLHNLCDPRLLMMSFFLIDYPFADRLYPGALEVLARLRTGGPTVILSDGDVVFQPRKAQRSGIWGAVDGHVLIYIHKERMLDDVARRYPARLYVMIDDKVRILAAMKQGWGDRLTTVFVRQGHYALGSQNVAAYPPADLTVERIGDLLDCALPGLPSMALSFFAIQQGEVSFTLTAVATILRDLALVSLVLFFLWRNREAITQIGWTFRNGWKDVALGIVLFVPVFFGANLLDNLLQAAGLSAPATPQPSFLTAQGPLQFLLAFVLVVVVALAEETIFRGYLLLRLRALLSSTVRRK